ncbi:MAG: SusC/RagA family TonB-linked outer membrane protein [Ferruginibacter sp.]
MRKFMTIVIVAILSVGVVSAQTRQISGKITDSKGASVPGATVKSKSGTAVAADENGDFKINVQAGDVLTVTSIDFGTTTVKVGSGATLNIQLVSKENKLEEVVVTGYGIKREPKALGTSVAKLSNKDITQAKVTNIATGLSGKISGLQINSVNSSVDQNTRITLRGNRSILGNNEALIVIDDIVMSRDQGGTILAQINPNDIDNISVLKGGSASAIYGSDGSNGVIIVTTKKGTKGKPVINYSNTTQFQEIAYLPDLQNKFGQYGGELDPNQYPGIVYFPENPFVPYVPYENQNYGPAFNGAAITIGAPVRFFNADGTFFDSLKHATYSAKPDAKKGFFDKGITEQNDLSISGGDDKSKFFLSIQDVNIKGTIPKDKNHRNSFRLNGTRDFGRLTVGYSADYTIQHSNTTPGSFGVNGSSAAFGGSYYQNRAVYWTVLNTPASIDLRDFRNWQTDNFANPNGYFNAYYGNPWWQIDASRLDQKRNTLIGNLSLSYKVTDWFNLQAVGAITRYDQTLKFTYQGFKFADWARADVYGSGRSTTDAQAAAFDGYTYNNRITGNIFANFTKDYRGFTGKLTLGGTTFDETARNMFISASQLVIPDFYNISNRVGEPGVFENFSQYRKNGAFADLSIGYHDYLFVHGTFRKDWDSRLDKNQRTYSYPSGDLAFVFTDAIPGLKDNNILSYGKLRAAIGKTGNVSVGPYSLDNVFNSAPNFPYGSTAGFTVSNALNNRLLKPEFTTEKEVGVDLGFMRNKITLKVAVYQSNTTNQTLPVQVSSSTGFTSALLNSGEMENKGIEVDLNLTAINNPRNGLRVDLGGNFSYNKNKVLSLYPGINDFLLTGAANQYVVKGAAFPQIKLSDWKRDAQKRIIVDKNSGFPTPNDSLSTYGTSNPPYKLGLNTSISYKGLTLSVLAEARFGAVIYNAIGNALDFTGVSAYSAQTDRARFVIPNSSYDDGTGKYLANQSIAVKNGNNDFWASTWNGVGSTYLNSADFWKIREVSLTYTFPKSILKNNGVIKQLSVSLVGRNLFTKRANENVWTDPEFSNTTGNAIGTTDINQNPPTKIYGANLNITF